MGALPQGSLGRALEDEGLWDNMEAAMQLMQGATVQLFANLMSQPHSTTLAPLLTGLDKSFLLDSAWL